MAITELFIVQREANIMNDMEIEVHEAKLEVRNKKAGGTYEVQNAYIHLTDRAGNPERYPTKFAFFPPRDPQNNPVPLSAGTYTIAPNSFRVGQGGFLELGFLDLVKVKKG